MGTNNRRDLVWGEDKCHICNDSTWISLVLYEPVDVSIDNGVINSHPAPDDEHPIMVCANCMTESQKQLADDRGVKAEEVTFDEMTQYLTYRVYPNYIEKLHPDSANRFSRMLSE